MTNRCTKLLPHITGKLRTEIFSLTTYTRLDYNQKDRAFVKVFWTVMNKQINVYHPCLYVNDNTSCENPAPCQISTSTFLYKPTHENNCTRHHTKIPPKLPVYTSLLLRLCTTIRTTLIHSRQKFIILFIKNQAQKSSHLLLSFMNISLSGKVVGNTPTVSQSIVGRTLLVTLGPVSPTPKRCAAT